MFLRERIAANSREGKFQFRLRQYSLPSKYLERKWKRLGQPISPELSSWLRLKVASSPIPCTSMNWPDPKNQPMVRSIKYRHWPNPRLCAPVPWRRISGIISRKSNTAITHQKTAAGLDQRPGQVVADVALAIGNRRHGVLQLPHPRLITLVGRLGHNWLRQAPLAAISYILQPFLPKSVRFFPLCAPLYDP